MPEEYRTWKTTGELNVLYERYKTEKVTSNPDQVEDNACKKFEKEVLDNEDYEIPALDAPSRQEPLY